MPNRPTSRSTHHGRRRPLPLRAMARLALAIALLGLSLADPGGRMPLASADSPPRNRAYVPPSRTVTNCRVCIDPGAGKPCFGLHDLQGRAVKWTIPPPIWGTYPSALDAVPLPTRTYGPETVEYLATHEIRAGDAQSGTFALTFDCETHPDRVRRILDTLRGEGVQVTFFLQGQFAYLHPELVRQMDADGHELGSHSFFHPLFTGLTPLQMTREITYTEAAIAWAVGKYVPMRYFRFPYAGRNGHTLRHVASLGYQSSYWDIDPKGWEPGKTAQDVVDYVRPRVHGGGIVILHCSSVNDIDALPAFLHLLRERGLKPGTLSEVLRPEDRDVPGYSLLPVP